ncbi:hypothetical protein J6590_020246 [Homalodisca vitripennis]|nr:hypothetical protein J6590_020246 [Homalodisca vitripennis]
MHCAADDSSSPQSRQILRQGRYRQLSLRLYALCRRRQLAVSSPQSRQILRQGKTTAGTQLTAVARGCAAESWSATVVSSSRPRKTTTSLQSNIFQFVHLLFITAHSGLLLHLLDKSRCRQQ